MSSHRWLWASLAVLLVAAGCSGDEGGAADLGDYFEQVEQITVDLEELREATDSLPQRDIETTRVFFAELNAGNEVALAALSALQPPAAVRDSHDRFVDLREQWVALNQRIVERLDSIETTEEFLALAGDDELGIEPQNALGDQVEEACRDLQAVADDEGIEAVLRCG